MSLSSGTKLGPYEIVSPLGAGGMGEVYRARDTRLDRTVAIKVLASHLSSSPELKQRMEREARAISSLNHPHICHLYDIGSQNGDDYLVMEFLEGETLDERLRRGALSLPEALQIGMNVAEALEVAHRQGIVHRDLKPANIMLTRGGAKLMDFGLAKPLAAHTLGAAANGPPSFTAAATASGPSPISPLTTAGAIVGTIQYMSPEQIEGKEADARSDIFAFGAVLYEMAAGKRPFEGKSQISIASAILEKDPEPIHSIKPQTPPALEHVVTTCLQKNPEDRFQSAQDIKLELRWIAANKSMPAAVLPPRSSFQLLWAVAAISVLAAIALGVMQFASREAKFVVATQIASSDKVQFNFVGDSGGPPVISPDGTQIVFSTKAEGKTQLYVRSLDKLTPQPLVGTQNATWPFWSPDSRSIAFFADSKLKRIDVSGGPTVVICDASNARGGTWSKNGTIVFEPFPTLPLYQVPAGGGTPVALTKLSGKFTTHRWPQFMPDGRHFIYLAANHSAPTGSDTAVFWASLDGKENRLVVQSQSGALYASGYLLYVRDSALVAQPFDPSAGELKGEPTVLASDVQVDGSVWRGTITASETGPLIYQPASAGAGMRLTWIDRNGREAGSGFGPEVYGQVELSPDNRKAAVTIGNPAGVIWIYDLQHSTRTRFTFGNGAAGSPVWSRDGKQIAYLSNESVWNRYTAMMKAADGSGEAKPLTGQGLTINGVQQGLWDWSPDGRYLLYRSGTFGVGDGSDIWALPLSGDGKPFHYIAGPGDQAFAQFSPDGRFVVYQSNETGRDEVYVAPFPWTGAKWQISTNSGIAPRWRRDGKEIVFQALGTPQTFAVQVEGHGSTLEVGEVRALFESNDLSPNTGAEQYALSSDGQRFLQITTGDAGKLPLTVIQNWTAELKKR